MKKVVLAGLACLLIMAIAGFIVFRTIAAKGAPGELSQDVGPKSAKALQDKVDAVRNAEKDPHHDPGSRRIELWKPSWSPTFFIRSKTISPQKSTPPRSIWKWI